MAVYSTISDLSYNHEITLSNEKMLESGKITDPVTSLPVDNYCRNWRKITTGHWLILS
jgi:hypothetical protein